MSTPTDRTRPGHTAAGTDTAATVDAWLAAYTEADARSRRTAPHPPLAGRSKRRSRFGEGCATRRSSPPLRKTADAVLALPQGEG